MIGRIFAGMGDSVAAERMLHKTFEQGWRGEELLFYLVEAAILRGALDEAERHLAVLVEHHPTSRYIALARADLCLERGDWEQARSFAVSTLNGRGPAYRVDVAVRLLRMPDGRAAAIRLIEEWLQLEPDSSLPHRYLAVLVEPADSKRSAAERERAIELYEANRGRSIEVRGTEIPPDLIEQLPFMMATGGDEERRIRLLLEWAQLRPDSVAVHRLLARALEARDPEASRRHATTAARNAAKNPDLVSVPKVDWDAVAERDRRRFAWPPVHNPFPSI